MPRSLARLSASAPSHRDLSLAVFITNIAESDFRYTQDSSAGFVPRFRLMHEPPADIPRQPALRTLPSCRGTRKSGCWLPLAIGESRRLLKRPMRPARAPASIVRADYPALAIHALLDQAISVSDGFLEKGDCVDARPQRRGDQALQCARRRSHQGQA